MTTELDLGWFDPSLRALQRREASGVSTGLSRAIAERLGVDVVIVRVVFIVLAFCAGLGLALYGWGTILTRGPQGTRPIDQVLPGFRDWSPLMQKLAVVISTIILVATLDAALPLPWGAGVLVLIALALVRRRARRAAAPTEVHYPSPFSPAAAPSTMSPVDDHTLVETWRRHIGDAVGTRRAAVPVPHLPTVDLYSEDEPPTPPRPATPQPKPNWWAGLGILAAMMATSFVSAGLLGLDMVVTLTATTAVGGLATVVLALALRHRRIPRLVLAALAASVVATGWLATQTASSPEFTEDTHVVRIVGTDGTVNLTDLELAGAKTLHVEVIASDVNLILPGPTKSMTTTGWLSDIRMGPDTTATDGNTTPNLNIEVSAKLSDVVIQEAS